MVLESWVIIIILAIAAYMFIRSGKNAWAPSVLPLMILPLANIVYSPIGRHIAESDASLSWVIRVTIYSVVFIAASLWAVAFSKRLPKGRSKYAYVFCAIIFTLLLAVIFFLKSPH